MRRTCVTIWLASAVAVLSLGLAGCEQPSVFNEDCVALCDVLVVDCELPGYQDSSCVPNCEQELEQLGDAEDLLGCYEDAGCSVVELIECRRLQEADRL
jgi:hypothetical protein